MPLNLDIPSDHPTPCRPGAAVAAELHGRLGPDGNRIGASYIWLSYSVFLFIQPFFHHSVRYWIETLAIFAVFLALYTRYVRGPGPRERIPLVASMYVLGTLTLPFNSGAACFYVYVAAMLPFSVERVRTLVLVMVGEVATLAAWALYSVHVRHSLAIDTLICSLFIPIAGISNIFVAQGKRADALLAEAQAENVTLAAVAERERIARDLHDVLGHTLSVIVLKTELAGRLLEGNLDPARARQEIAEVEHTARTALAEVREAITGYRSKGLAAELDQARLTLAAAGVALRLDTLPPGLAPEAETAVALALREAVTNIVRHAGASACTMHFSRGEGVQRLVIEDNGSGAFPAGVGAPTPGNGLRGMGERMEAQGGRTRMESGFLPGGGGTRLWIELPDRALAAVAAVPAVPDRALEELAR